MALAKFDATIPVIDMNDFYSPSRHRIFVQELRDAMQKVGFVAVVNSRVDKYVLDDAYAEAKLFYALPLDYKMRAHVPHLSGQRGYVQSEIAKGQAKKDHKEFYHMTRDYPEDILAKYHYERNIWPAGSNFKPAMQALISALDEYTVLIEQALAEGIGEHKDFFSKMTKHGSYVMRSIHYPANPPTNCVWAAAHTDIDLFTILPRATAD